ncbi:glycolipid 2-alpha-mannosyltransferase-domain-containing protein, partial [Mycena olivaceomarginata]
MDDAKVSLRRASLRWQREITKLIGNATAGVSFGLVPKEHWFQPEWIDEDKACAGRNKMVAQDIIYAGSVPYRNMCRFNSGFSFQHPLLQLYRYYWRVEPDVEYFCNMLYDPFHFMQQEDKIYEVPARGGRRSALGGPNRKSWRDDEDGAGASRRMGATDEEAEGEEAPLRERHPTAKSAALLSELLPRRGRRPFELWPRGGRHVLRPTFPSYEDGAFSIARAAHAYELRPAFLCARRFTISFYEWESTIPMLWANVKEFIALHPEYVVEDNAMAYLSDDGGRRIICVISGPTSKSSTCPSGARPPTPRSSHSSSPRA